VSIIRVINPTQYALQTATGESIISLNSGGEWILKDDSANYTIKDVRSGMSRPLNIYMSLEEIERKHPEWLGLSLLTNKSQVTPVMH
jgi:hypothetical protein